MLTHFKGKTLMQIWIDADACPNAVKEILFRAAERVQVELILVANHLAHTPPSRFIRAIQVPSGFDVADKEIERRLAAGDLVITADIPLAAAAIERGAHALNPRGTFYTPENIRQILGRRNFMDELRATGIQTGGPPALSLSDRKAFASELDRFLTHHCQTTKPAGE
jgi:uncharacterized protein YaiI (UPF0178 family)